VTHRQVIGLSMTKELIAHRLLLSIHTFETHLRATNDELGVASLTWVAFRSARRG
jgi:DNA-binding CsgD family transcriptional regulator